MARVTTYVLISCRQKQTIVHFAEPRFKKNLRPICYVAGWQSRIWEKDPAGGVGATICQRCEGVADRRAEKSRKLRNVRRMRGHWRHRDERLKQLSKYRQGSRRKRRIYDSQERIREQRRQYMREYRKRQQGEQEQVS